MDNINETNVNNNLTALSVRGRGCCIAMRAARGVHAGHGPMAIPEFPCTTPCEHSDHMTPI